MAALCWALLWLLSAGHSLAAVDETVLSGIVNNLLSRYKPSYINPSGESKPVMFSLAVTVPVNNNNRYDTSLVTDPEEAMKQRIVGCGVYKTSSMVAATVLRWPDVVKRCPNGLVQWPINQEGCGNTWAEVKQRCPGVFEKASAAQKPHGCVLTLPVTVRRNKLQQFEHCCLFVSQTEKLHCACDVQTIKERLATQLV